MIFDKLKKILKSGDAKKESDTEYDGMFSYAAEWHSSTHGLYDGMKSMQAAPSELPDNEDVQSEPHYYKGAYVIGTLLQLCVVAASAILTHGVL